MLLSCTLPAAVVAGGGGGGAGGGSVQTTNENGGTGRNSRQPAWVEDPTQGGKVKAGVLTWPSGADRETQRQNRKAATEALRATFKLPPTAKIKDMDTWTDGAGATYILLVVR